MKNPLLDYDFLKRLDSYPHKTVYAKIILLDFNEFPVYEIQGRISAGNVNVDGASAIRRSCSLTMITNQEKIDNIYWGLKNKFKLEIGLKNNIDLNYNDIIWFKQGLFVITSLNESLNASNHTINISGKDKGCLLNGEIGGTIPSTTDFGKMDITEIDENDNTIVTTLDIPIKEIIKNAVVTFGGESLHNIIINDIDNYGMELMAYKGETPLYMLFDENIQMVTNMTFDEEQKYYGNKNENNELSNYDTLKNLVKVYNSYIDQMSTENRTIIYSSRGTPYSVIKFDNSESVGYRKTELTYPGDLIANAGEALTSVLDKIKNMFSTFEYFYDIDGHFIFQKKKTYVNSSWNNIRIKEDEIYVDGAALTSQFVYSFTDNQLLTAISKQPTLTNLKNDFAIQGTRKGITGADILIHMRYAISDKPTRYINWDKKEYTSDEYDWRELIYQMALDYFKHNQEETFLQTIAQNNLDLYPTGKTGYEMFYTDLQGYWRTLYNPSARVWKDEDPEWVKEQPNDKQYIEKSINSVSKGLFHKVTGWHYNVEHNPAVLDFWFDFMDTTGEMGKYSIQTIGHRPKAVNDSKAVAIYYKQVPQILFVTGDELQDLKKENLQDFYNLSGYNFIQISSAYEKYFSISSRQKSAQDALDDLLYQHLYCSENVTLTSIPIYYLQPNNRIFVRDNKTNINGEYLINKITIPLTYNGTSSISAQLAPDRLY